MSPAPPAGEVTLTVPECIALTQQDHHLDNASDEARQVAIAGPSPAVERRGRADSFDGHPCFAQESYLNAL